LENSREISFNCRSSLKLVAAGRGKQCTWKQKIMDKKLVAAIGGCTARYYILLDQAEVKLSALN
jgi:hypothetical protein